MWKLLIQQRFLITSCRNVHSQCSAQALNDRSIVKVSGPDAGPFLQGLMTNDIKHLEENKSIYCMFLNTQGRILYDTLVYSGSEPGNYLIECDSACSKDLASHLTRFRVRRKVAVTLEESLKTLVLFEPPPDQLTTDRDVIVARDPRTKSLGWRVITDLTHFERLKDHLQMTEKDLYTELKYKLGIGEGVSDLPPASCFPLECNCDYLHGVSFHKGCYLGQELTARTYHTGVVRKRLMPVIFHQPLSTVVQIPSDAKVTDSSGATVGKLRSLPQPGSVYGLGLLRIQQVLNASSTLTVNDCPITTCRPDWWPIEAPKDRSRMDPSASLS